MAAEMARREVAAPTKDWLSEREVCELIEVSERTLDRLIEEGQFPRAVKFPGQANARWRWVDVTWFLLGREVADRLLVPAGAPVDEPNDNGTPTKRQRNANGAQS